MPSGHYNETLQWDLKFGKVDMWGHAIKGDMGGVLGMPAVPHPGCSWKGSDVIAVHMWTMLLSQ